MSLTGPPGRRISLSTKHTVAVGGIATGVGSVTLLRRRQDALQKAHSRGVRIRNAKDESGGDYETVRESVVRAGV
jgi:hypothetical protein